jgi:hypothetical protein
LARRQKDRIYLQRGTISIHLSSNAKLNANHLDALKWENDFFIRGAFTDLQTIPPWICALGPDKEPDDSDTIKSKAAKLKASLDRTGTAPIEVADAERFVRTYMGTHSTIKILGHEEVIKKDEEKAHHD